MDNVLEFYLMVENHMHEPMWVGDNDELTDDFTQARPYADEESAQRAADVFETESPKTTTTYVFALLGSK